MALIAGGEPSTALRLGVSMTALQASIGTVNDLIDAPIDRGRKPGKPIPAGLIGPTVARWVAALTAAAGLVLAVPSGATLVGLALVVLGIGYAYDRWAKGTRWSWVPFALGIPLLPVYGWLGATGGLAVWFLALLPMAALAGTALALANARADLERDLDAGTASVAVDLGSEGSWRLLVAIWLLTGATAIGSAIALGAAPMKVIAVGAGVGIVLIGAWTGRRASPDVRERAWQIQAVGTGTAAIAWVLAVG